jgi:HAD superfamily hydrolase (TIGR01549 family)
MQIKYVLFDCWQTLFTLEFSGKFPLVAFAEALGKDINDPDYMKLFSRDFMIKPGDLNELLMNHMACEFPKKKDDTVLISELMNYLRALSEGLMAYDDTFSCLERLKSLGYKIGMISNAIPHSTNALIEKFNYEKYFDSCTYSYEVGYVKPDNKIFNCALNDLKCISYDCAVMVGDTPHDDYFCAKKLGMEAILIDRRNKHSSSNMNIITTLDDLTSAIAQI